MPDHGSHSLPAPAASSAALFAALALVLVVALAVEQTYRVYVFGTAAWSYARIDSVQDLWVSGLIRAAANPEISYELSPGLDAWFKLAPLRTNSAGLRDVERARAKPPGVVRAALVGSSFSMPAGVALEDAWHHVAERMLDARRPGTRHEIVNFAVGGYNARQNLAVLADKALAYEPDLVIFELTTHLPYMVQPDDFHRRPFVAAPREHPFWRSFVVDRIRAQFATPAADPSPYPEAALAGIADAIARAAAIARERGIPICFVVLNMDAAHRPERGVARAGRGRAFAVRRQHDVGVRRRRSRRVLDLPDRPASERARAARVRRGRRAADRAGAPGRRGDEPQAAAAGRVRRRRPSRSSRSAKSRCGCTRPGSSSTTWR